jgi:signal transduction histidine kinase
MNFAAPWFPALRHKITLGYYIIATLFILLVLLTLLELRLFEENIEAGGQITDFFDVTLEIRRFEKNYFLYHQDLDYHENQKYVAQALRLLQDNAEAFNRLSAQPAALAEALRAYAGLMRQYRDAGAADLEPRIRQAGKHLVDSGEQLARSQRARQRASLERQRQRLLVSAVVLIVAVLAMGRWLAWRVAQPLRQMEAGMKAVAGGNLVKLNIPTHDREIVLLIEAFNRMLEEIEIRQHYLARSEKLAALGTLLSGVAHELNNPLSNISSSCQILQEELGSADPEYQQELLAQIDEQTNRARNIARSLLDFTRVRGFQSETLQLHGLLQETVQFLKGQLPARLELILELPAGLRVEGDKQRLQQVFLNLLKNAVEAAAPPGQVKLRASAWQPQAVPELVEGYAEASGQLRQPPLPAQKCFSGDGVRIEIMDNGAGIAAELLPRIFDPFFTTKDVGHGSGLGLFIAHEIIEEHGGCVSAANRPEGGAVFTVWLPAGSGETI